MRKPPVISNEARKAALDKAALVRKERAKIRERLVQRQLTLADLLSRVEDDVVGKMKLLSVLEAMPGIGKVTSRKIMREIGIDEKRRLRGLGVQQRVKLLAKFSEDVSTT